VFKLKRLHIIDHPFLGHLDLNFVDDGEEKSGPYTSILIGKNGTGKSILLRVIADLIEDLKLHFSTEQISTRKRGFRTNFRCEGTLFIQGKSIDFVFSSYFDEVDVIAPKSKRKFEFRFYYKEKPSIEHKPLVPENLSVSAYLVNDKFRFSGRETSEFYKYLGLRETANSAGTKSYLNRIVPHVVDYIRKDSNFSALKRTLEFLEFDQNQLDVIYTCRYKAQFFHGNLTPEELNERLDRWKKFSDRKEEPRYYAYFKKHVRDIKPLLKRLAWTMNFISNSFAIKPKGNSKFKINLLQHRIEIEVYQILSRLDLITSPEIILSKKGVPINLQQASSGEFHFFTSVLGLLVNLRDNSLVLIDEPEISFHPNWQLRYLYYLREIFKNYKTCHFIIATHSHFIISDLDPKTSSVVRLTRDTEGTLRAQSIKEITFGLSAEEILYRVFELRTYRNYFFEIELRELLHLISNKSQDKARITTLVQNLRKVELDKNDPLTLILTQADEYLQGL
jgi:predicted ATP-dependent endonuclease of OLD family